ncbi:hypothetical protein CBR_g55246 [Chara braunii]|uniref:Reverse transcriptase domain-containing protein n=1 Tax=Chara braunii TaxID=69332 RepID=A0A388MCZ4_CHABU|nr:hypothetical protein CBR_g55246 [Chara braunii]|eukprot:GBG92365.1 hypothetical protein CBR_g55246 [Chara braunii]
MSADPIFRVTFDDRIKVAEVRKIFNDLLMQGELPSCFLNRTWKKIRFVWVKNPSVSKILHNQRAFAARDVLTCKCAGLPFPRSEGHVRVRVSELEGIHPLLRNANNVPQVDREDRLGLLQQELVSGFQQWSNWKGKPPEISREMLSRCITDRGAGAKETLLTRHVEDLKARLEGLVLTPLDRNPGETVAMCPVVYFNAMMSSFVLNPGYRVVEVPVGQVYREIREDFASRGLTKFVRWDRTGEFGSAYLLPKHKDLDRFRPICPTYREPMVRTGKVVSCGLNFLLKSLPKKWHFNLISVTDLAGRLEKVNNKLLKQDGDFSVSTLSFDIKEMFSRLPHSEIRKALTWLLDYHMSKGRSMVRVNTRGKGASFGVTTGADHCRCLNFVDMRDFVCLELEHTYTFATNVLLNQVVGIPMGKTTSPPLACILCAFAEFLLLQNLGSDSRFIDGTRLMDDVLLNISAKDDRKKLRLLEAFDACYPAALTLKRTDDDSGHCDFLGCVVRTKQRYPYLSCVQMSKNEDIIWTDGPPGQSFLSWGCKKQKSAAICSCLHRIDRNTTVRSEILRRVHGLKQELFKKDFPADFFMKVLKRFAFRRDEIWMFTVKLLED